MKVLKEGHWPDPKEWSQEHTCPHCRSRLEVQARDITYKAATGGNPHDHCPETFSIKCSFCNNNSGLSPGEIPRSIRKFLGSYK